VLIGAANRDPDQFPDAERFDPARHPNRHLAFGLGPHFCLGAHLARQQATVALEALVRRFSGAVVESEPGAVTYRRSAVVRGLERLALRFEATSVARSPIERHSGRDDLRRP
jgi:cytochrome P450